MDSQSILKLFLEFYEERKHVQIPNHSLLPDNDPTLLFVNSGMFPLVPYFTGEPHPMGKRLVNVQRSLRFEDIEEIGDIRHTTCFHMLGNWSLGDYFKKEQLPWVYEFFIEKLNLDPKRFFATVFIGDEYAPKDIEAIEILKAVFAKYGVSAKEGERIFPAGREDNWWQRGEAIGELGGPDSEIFYYLGDGPSIGKNPTKNQNEFLEIGNNVFMQYQKTNQGWKPLAQKNVDFGGGLERIALVVQGKKDIFETDNFWPIILEIQKQSNLKYLENSEITRAMRILADHIRASVFLAMDGVIPSNKDQGYALRRFLRRIVRYGRKLDLVLHPASGLVKSVCENFSWLYPELKEKELEIVTLFQEEEEKFAKTLIKGEKELASRLNKTKNLSPKQIATMAFDLYQSSGFPPELFWEELSERNLIVGSFSQKDFFTLCDEEKSKHQALSRSGAEQKFKGGLANYSKEVIGYHTTTHLLHEALRKTLGENIHQEGSNITSERLRFDFTYSSSLTNEEIKKVENIVNETISKKLSVNFVILPKKEAEKTQALHFFKEKYPDMVKIYFIGNSLENAFSKEFCGGPHVKNLSELKPTFVIYKQENLGKGIRRIYGKFN